VNQGRPISSVLEDILRSLQEIVRSEVRLAKAEIRDDATQAAASAVWIAAGTIGALSAWAFLLWTITFALSTRMSMWAATLVVAVVLACAASVLIIGGIRRVKRIQPIPERTIASIKENVEWMRHPAK
jgi:Putative Actinobacterial Holin-X, holin superfamily III